MSRYKTTILPLLLVGAMLTFTIQGNAEQHTGKKTDSSKATALFAGGCFWCMQPAFDKTNGVIDTVVGYTGGHTSNPTYEEVGTGRTGHYEAIEVHYNPDIVTYSKLLDSFWRNIDPFDASGQFCDKGPTYRSAIFYLSPEQKKLAEETKKAVEERFKQPVVTEILKANTFWPAEAYHQDYYIHNPVRYKFYRYRCGRDARLKELWGDEAPH